MKLLRLGVGSKIRWVQPCIISGRVHLKMDGESCSLSFRVLSFLEYIWMHSKQAAYHTSLVIEYPAVYSLIKTSIAKMIA